MLRTAALLLVGCLGMLGTHAAVDGMGAFMYGLSKNLPDTTTWWIVELNPLTKREEPVKDTGILATNSANSLAFDTARNQLLFLGFASSPQPTDGVYVFDVNTLTLTKFDTLAAMQFPGGDVPFGAAYYDNSYWYAYWQSKNVNLIGRATFDYTNGLPSGVASVNLYSLATPLPNNLDFTWCNDIAIDIPNKMLYCPEGWLEIMVRVDLSDLTVPLPVTTYNTAGEVWWSYQNAFNADFTTLWGQQNGEWFTVNTATYAQSSTVWESAYTYIDLGGSSVGGVLGSGCLTQYASVKTKAAKSARRGGHLRYRAYLKNGNETLASIDALRLEVALPPEVAVLSSSSNLKRRGVVGTAGPASFAWTGFNLTKHKSARFDLKLRVSGTATKGQVLMLNTTLYQERSGLNVCPQVSSLQVRVR